MARRKKSGGRQQSKNSDATHPNSSTPPGQQGSTGGAGQLRTDPRTRKLEEELKKTQGERDQARKEIEDRGLRLQDIERKEKAAHERARELDERDAALDRRDQALKDREEKLEEREAAVKRLEQEALDKFRAREADVRRAWFEQRRAEVEAELRTRQLEVEEELERRQQEAEAEIEARQKTSEAKSQRQLELAGRTLSKAQQDANRLVEEAQTQALEHQTRSRTQTTQALEDWQTRLHTQESVLREREAALETREGSLARRERQLEQKETALEEDEADVAGERKRLKERESVLIEREVACSGAAIGRLEGEKELLEQKLKVHFEENLELRRTLETRNRALEAGSPEQLLQENARLRQELDRHLQQLEQLPSEAELALLRRNAQAAVEFEARNRDLEARLSLLEQEKRARERERLETESFRRERDTLRLVNEHLIGQKEELERLLGELKSTKGEVFANLSRMAAEDRDDTEVRRDGDDLEALARRARAWMWHLPPRRQLEAGQSQDGLFAHYYDAHTMRAFVASMASSRLLILQGVSGTGKTSLPEYFTHAVGGAMTRVEVQSSWRDRPDLLGFYNAFYRQFNESPFARALFQAGTRQYRQRPYFVVLDEANLSRIEYYFADLLSIMEGNPNERAIELLNHDPTGGSLPEGLHTKDGAVRLPIPHNVWFVCTANTDESTYEITRKVYDRAQVIQLDGAPDIKTDAPPQTDAHPLKMGLEPFLRGVQEAVRGFDDNKRRRVQDALEPIREELRQHFKVGYGQRLLDQLNVFMPVYEAAGGTRGKGLDHFIARKLLWQVLNRTDPNVRKGLEALLEAVNKAFERGGLGRAACCEEVLQHEINRFRR